MNTKKIILTNVQLYEVLRRVKEAVNEENNVNVSLNTTGNTISSLVNTVSQNKSQINNASRMGDPVIHISNPSAQNGSDDNQLTQHVEVEKGQTIEKAMQDQLNPAATASNSDVEISGPGVSEGRCFSKKAIEEMRLGRCKTYTKKQLDEAFENEDMLRKEMRGLSVKAVLDAYKLLGGDPQDLASVDIADAVIEKYNAATPEEQERVRKFLCI
jgi:hypothetical protein